MLRIEDQRVRIREVEFGADFLLVLASDGLRFASENREQVYGWVERVLVGQEYAQIGKSAPRPFAALKQNQNRCIRENSAK